MLNAIRMQPSLLGLFPDSPGLANDAAKEFCTRLANLPPQDPLTPGLDCSQVSWFADVDAMERAWSLPLLIGVGYYMNASELAFNVSVIVSRSQAVIDDVLEPLLEGEIREGYTVADIPNNVTFMPQSEDYFLWNGYPVFQLLATQIASRTTENDQALIYAQQLPGKLGLFLSGVWLSMQTHHVSYSDPFQQVLILFHSLH